MTHRNAHATKTAEELLEDLRTLVSDAEALLSDSVKEHSAEAVEALSARFEALKESLGGTYERARKKVSAGAHYADEAIRENPYQSIAIAAGVGVLVGVLLARSNR
jgi:ElaB/YqjD/DUF883 family membrane-anchored ribosome-binding protein